MEGFASYSADLWSEETLQANVGYPQDVIMNATRIKANQQTCKENDGSTSEGWI